MSLHVVFVDLRFNRLFHGSFWRHNSVGYPRPRYNSVGFVLYNSEFHLLNHFLHKTGITLWCHHAFNVHNMVILGAVAHDWDLFKSDPTLFSLVFEALIRHLPYELISLLS